VKREGSAVEAVTDLLREEDLLSEVLPEVVLVVDAVVMVAGEAGPVEVMEAPVEDMAVATKFIISTESCNDHHIGIRTDTHGMELTAF